MKKLALPAVILLAILVGAVCLAEQIFGVNFESSDGLWCDSTCPFKARGFSIVLADFEKYRSKVHDPGLALVRTTRPPLHFFSLTRKPEWCVPYAKPSGHANPFL
ncbi:MAG: hypothetical protein NTZ46_02635 [Verrucomicrobia bacterium]|nr:hypothetical protein [Verrucomicrobiota bacterium]